MARSLSALPRPSSRAGSRAGQGEARTSSTTRTSISPTTSSEGTTFTTSCKIMGDARRPVDALRHSAAADVVVRQLRRLRADVLPPDRRAALLLLVHRRVHRDARTGRCTKEEQARFDPMITGFNPADMYAVDHIRRVLQTFPGVFSGIGEFTIHKEFVSSKVAGEAASLTNPALDRILDFAGEVGLVVILHNDIDMPFAKTGAEPVYLTQMKALLERHPKTTIIWAHMGLGRVVHPAQSTGRRRRRAGAQPGSGRDRREHPRRSGDESRVLRHLLGRGREVHRRHAADGRATAALINRYPDRFLFGTDNVAPTDSAAYFAVYEMYAPTCKALTPDASEKIRIGNYERLFDDGRRRVREWERTHVK